jgi:hypothetical protein
MNMPSLSTRLPCAVMQPRFLRILHMCISFLFFYYELIYMLYMYIILLLTGSIFFVQGFNKDARLDEVLEHVRIDGELLT